MSARIYATRRDVVVAKCELCSRRTVLTQDDKAEAWWLCEHCSRQVYLSELDDWAKQHPETVGLW